MTKLMLPPGADGKPHPAFMVDRDGDFPQAWFHPSYPNSSIPFNILIYDGCAIPLVNQPRSPFSLVAAAAIAHYWTQHYHRKGWARHGSLDMASIWYAIAAGSRDYDNCKIVEYKE